MSRLSFRPRPLDIHKKLPIVKSVKEFEDDDTTTSTRNSHILRLAAEADNEVQHVVTKRLAHEIPIPQFVVVDTYERDYTRTFAQPTSYLRARGARSELGDFVEYDLDNEDEDWLEEFNKEKPNITPEEFEVIIFKLEVFDHKARERAGVITPTLGSPIPVLLRFDAAVEAMLSMSVTYGVFQSIYNYWKEKRERWQKPILRRLQVLLEWRSYMPLSLIDHLLHFIDSLIRFSEQLYFFRFPPPPVNDTNPYNVFRPREKAHRLHTRRMQRRENNVQSFERLRQVRRNIDQAKTLLLSLIKREEKKREVMEIEVSLQRIQMKYKDEAELLDDSLVMSGLQSYYNKFVSSEDEFVDADDIMNNLAHTRISAVQNSPYTDSKLVMVSNMKRDFRRKNTRQGWLHKLDPSEPVLMFTKPLDSEKLGGAGIVAPQVEVDSDRPYKYHGRIGRGGRIVFDRWNPLAFEN